METSSTLSVKTKVLRERLRNAELKALLHKVANSPSVVVKVARGEALVGAIEEWEMLLCPHNFSKLHPLLSCRIYAGGVMGTGVKEDDRAFRSRLQSPIKTIEIEAFSRWVKVWVCC